ncbi:hypothetical protein GGR57DRAFT_299589 [Xylariaceae sp. FL1272]|nr:hypothetical protein GGR57DRAFT_299589 [Xylariaceae sp. FL1272]
MSYFTCLMLPALTFCDSLVVQRSADDRKEVPSQVAFGGTGARATGVLQAVLAVLQSRASLGADSRTSEHMKNSRPTTIHACSAATILEN